ncbi:hypothetical protein BC941DRAFT_428098 [Chlamydoabsidia padenii]|nr:hypothetical protein BC941DRAFT_428098 [Chlamydoabsidia padenii]
MFMGTLLLVFLHYDWAFFLDCCLWCFVISFCFCSVKFCLLVGCCILVLCNVARNDVNGKILSNTYLGTKMD